MRVAVASGVSSRRSVRCCSERLAINSLTISSSSNGDFSSKATIVSCIENGGSFRRSTINWISWPSAMFACGCLPLCRAEKSQRLLVAARRTHLEDLREQRAEDRRDGA